MKIETWQFLFEPEAIAIVALFLIPALIALLKIRKL